MDGGVGSFPKSLDLYRSFYIQHAKPQRRNFPEQSVETFLMITTGADKSIEAPRDALSARMQARVIVIIPALNEESSIAEVVRNLPRSRVHEIIVVDNGSTDTTASAAQGAGATVLHENRKGYGYACLRGIERAVQEKADIIAFIDGDLSDFPEDLPLILKPIQEEGFDLVIGSRMIGRREPGAMLPQALFGNWLASRLIRLFWGYSFTDLGPFRAVRVDALQRMNMADPTYGWTVEMQIKAAKLKLRCTEVPVRYRRRIGTSKVTGTVRGTIGASVKILYTIARYVFTDLEPGAGKEERLPA
jgi:glycosyltransferase involved in cell wall biosynthesis